MTSCPTCGKPVDSLRAPAVRVSGGKVVPYCSKDCVAVADAQSQKIASVVQLPVAPKPAAGEPSKPKQRTPASGVPQDREVDSGPVIEVLHEPASGVVTSAADARSQRAKSNPRAETDGAIEIADTGHIDDYVAYESPTRSRALIVVLLLLLVLGGGAAAAYYLGYFDELLQREEVKPPVQTKAVEPEPVVVIDAPPPLTPAIAVDRATTVLREQMKSESPRVRRVAASALARTQDKAAIDVLASSLNSENSDLAKLDIAYALARGGDKRGSDALLAAVGSGKRDPRLEAGRRLALLGDKRAVHVLDSYLSVTQLKLGTAEQLAYLAEPRAIAVLEEVRADPQAVADEKNRATIALGHAGRSDVAPALHELLKDKRQNAFAAIALANLRDEAARPVLVEQLRIPSLRVQAARALRRLDPEADVAALLPPLLDALESKKDTEQVQIAEAILLLAGPPTWSERE